MTIEQKMAEIYQFMKNEPDKYMPGETYVEHIDHFQSIIKNQAEEIERLKDGLHRAVLLLDKYETMLGESPC